MIKFKNFIIINLFLIIILVSTKSFSENHNVLEVLELIQKDLKTLEKAVYSDSSNDSLSDSTSLIAIQGPESRNKLKKVLNFNDLKFYHAEEIEFNNIAPHLIVADVVTSAEFYRDSLGFDFNRFWGEPPNFVILFRGSVQLMLSQDKTNAPQPLQNGEFDAYIWLNQGIDKLFYEYKQKKVEIVEPLETTFFQMQQFLIKDNSGYVLCFGQEV